ncbi:MAG TPA: NAD-dependent epimerase/dehydratase family protein [Solirubrobacteraceae bacterium]|jgi:nucleoside-diphosphate-sugar epimerase
MRVFVAGASGVVGVRLLPLLVEAGHDVAGMTRSPNKIAVVRALGAEPVLCDVYDADALRAAIGEFRPDALLHQLTDLPDDAAQIPALGARNDRMLREGTANLLGAARLGAVERILAQSVAWELPGERGAAYRDHERAVLDAGGVVVRLGQLYGPGTYYESEKPDPPRIQVDEAARWTVAALDEGEGIVEIVE